MWKPEHRRAADRRGLRYPSDLSDAEWALVEPLIPPAKHGGRKRSVDLREVLNAIDDLAKKQANADAATAKRREKILSSSHPALKKAKQA